MKDLLLRNWHLKLISLALATILWAQVARTPTSEIALSVSLQLQNIPSKTAVYGDTAEQVEVRLRGPSSLVRTLTSSDVSLSIDMRGVSMGQEKVLPLTPEMVDAPFGVEVVQVIPARVRLTVEPIETRIVPIVPTLEGTPAKGFEIGKSAVTPNTIQIEGPASHVSNMEAIPTTPVDVRDRGENFEETVELDVQDPLVRHRSGTIKVQVQIRRAR